MQKIFSDNRIVFLLFLIIALLFYGNSIGNSYSFDDSYVTVTNFRQQGQKYAPNNPLVAKGFAGIPKIWRSLYGHGNGTAYDYRPVVSTLFAVEFALVGQSPRAGHCINVIIYGAVLFLLFLVLKRILVAYPFSESFAFVCCLLFAAHPIHTEVVASLKSRDELLALFFGLLSVWHVLIYEEKRKMLSLIWASLFLMLGIYSKLTTAVFIGLIPVTLWMFTKTNKRHIVFFMVGALVLYFIQSQIRKVIVTEKEFRILYHFENPMATEHFSFMMRVLFGLKSLGIYTRLMIFPWPLRYYYGTAVITSDIPFSDTDIWLGILFLMAAFIFCYRTKNKLAIYGLFFFYLSLAPVLNFIKPVAGIIGERLLFIPSVGFLFFVTAVIFYFLKDAPMRFAPSMMLKKPVLYITCLVPVFLVQDWRRTSDWKDEITLFEHDSKYLEHSAGANNLLANKYAEFLYSGDPHYPQRVLVEKCLEHYRLAAATDSSVFTALNNAGSVIFRFKNQPELALKYFLSAVRIQPDYPQAYENIGDCYISLGRKSEAAAAYQRAIDQNEKQFRSYLQLASLRIDAGEFDQAISVLTIAEKHFPETYPVIERIGTCYYQKGEKQKGLQQLEKAYQLYPNKQLAERLFTYFSSEGESRKAALYKESASQ